MKRVKASEPTFLMILSVVCVYSSSYEKVPASLENRDFVDSLRNRPEMIDGIPLNFSLCFSCKVSQPYFFGTFAFSAVDQDE